MKKMMHVIIIILAFGILVSGITVAQDKKPEASGKKVSSKFLTTWKKIGNKTKEIRSFKTEKATTVAGVRGAEAEDEALKFLYYKGGIKYPSRLELKNAIQMLEAFVQENPLEETVPESKFFIAQCYAQLGETDKAISVFEELIKNHAKSEFAQFAKDELNALKKD